MPRSIKELVEFDLVTWETMWSLGGGVRMSEESDALSWAIDSKWNLRQSRLSANIIHGTRPRDVRPVTIMMILWSKSCLTHLTASQRSVDA